MWITAWASGTEFPARQSSQLCHDKTAWRYRTANWREKVLSVRTVWIKRVPPYRRLVPVSFTGVLKVRILTIPNFHTQKMCVCVCVTPFTKPRRSKFHTHLLPFGYNRWKSSVPATIRRVFGPTLYEASRSWIKLLHKKELRDLYYQLRITRLIQRRIGYAEGTGR